MSDPTPDQLPAAMPPLRIVHASPFFDPATRFGGPVVQLRNVCRLLADRGHDVSVVTTDLGVREDTPRDQWVRKDGYRVWYARTSRASRYAPHYAPRVTRPLELTLAEADVLHLSLSFTHLNAVARRIALLEHVPYVYAPRSCLDPVRLSQRRLAKMAFMGLFERRVIRDAAAVHVLTDVERDQAIAQGADPDRCVIIPNGAELGPHTSWPEGVGFRRQFDLPVEAPLVLFMGRLHRVKGLDLLVDAFARTHDEQPDAQLVVAGPDDGQAQAVRNQARRLGVADSVHLVGHLERDMRLAALVAADVFALTSYSEGIPNAALDAGAAGAPLLITSRCNLPEVGTADAGTVVEPCPHEIAAALAAMLNNVGRRRTMGFNARKLVNERFSFPAVVDRIEDLYHELAGLPERRPDAQPDDRPDRLPDPEPVPEVAAA